MDEFSNYFETAAEFANLHTRLDPDQMHLIERLSCPPLIEEGRDYPEVLLIYHQCGGGYGCQALPFFRFTQSISAEITRRLSRLPVDYIGIHIRHSDVKLDYRSFLRAVKPQVEGRDVVVCTDSYEAMVHARNILDNSTIHQIANIPDLQGQRLHENYGVTGREINIGCLADLIALANARRIIIPSGPDVFSSGFAQLAMALSGRNDLIRQLLGPGNWKALRVKTKGKNQETQY